eukprot:9499995-Pyramimonas_sp.AAC.1
MAGGQVGEKEPGSERTFTATHHSRTNSEANSEGWCTNAPQDGESLIRQPCTCHLTAAPHRTLPYPVMSSVFLPMTASFNGARSAMAAK